MAAAKIALLPDRGVVAVTGADARAFLDNLITNDMAMLDATDALFAGLLSPQGKLLFDFFVVKNGEGYLLDVAADQAAALVQRLSMYKLRAKVVIADRSTDYSVIAEWSGHRAVELPSGSVLFRDPRQSGLGFRSLLMPPESLQGATSMLVSRHEPFDDYHAHRIALGVPDGGKDYDYGDTFPHEALFDHLNGVSFTKGCYVGQEIVARMEHRGTARKRIIRVTGQGPLPPTGTDLLAGEVSVGRMGSSAGGHGLALLRLDRVAEFAAKGVGLTAGGRDVIPNANDVTQFMPKTPDPIALG